MSNIPGVIIKSKFKLPQATRRARRYTTYLSYIDRPETKARSQQFENYHDYMEDELKSSGLFTATQDRLSATEREQLREIFRRAQENGSILWQDVISFDEAWLQEVGVKENRYIDEQRLMQATRNAITLMIEKEQMLHAIWTAAIHYNTDNIHVHVATVETIHPRERGKRKPKTIDTMKAQVVHALADRTREQEKLNTFIRDEVLAHKRNHSTTSASNRILHPELVRQYKTIQKQLPDDKRQWYYNMNGMKELRPSLNRLTDTYLATYFEKEHSEFKQQLDTEVAFYERSYGSASQATAYRKTKEQDLYTRMGNAILSEMRESSKSPQKVAKTSSVPSPKQRIQSAFQRERIMQETLYQIGRHMNDEWDHIKNQRAFEQLEQEVQHER
ncbi:MobP2 family relaxase [Exiguobacterium artemiae]|uniref:MobP2 family relaxase n=1 Tax=Exiguobacterium artemiae TaxID=340145 RepID=UPI002963F9A5|nr:MobP2 family relaxase [Exiguobacterium sibiricum]MDW2886726.1 MobP2 family relaxase [Exiguobacterium sibiricum]